MRLSNPRRSVFTARAALLLPLAVQTCSASSIAAWWTALGPQVIAVNSTTNGIMYSDCNSNNTPIFDTNNPKFFKLSNAPRAGTPVAGAGYYQTGENPRTAASFWYIDTNGNVVNSYQLCNTATGEFESTDTDQEITTNMPKPGANSGLASILLSATDGYRIFYQDDSSNVQLINYDPSSSKFLYGGVVSQDKLTGSGLSTAFSSYNNITVAMAKANSIEIAEFGQDNKWWLETFPYEIDSIANNATSRQNITANSQAPLNFTLPAWNGNQTVNTAINQYNTISVFYIGTDKHLYEIYSWYGAWQFATNQSTTIWPLADEASADAGIAWDETSLTMRLYYFSGGKLTEVAYENNSTWVNAALVPQVNATSSSPTSNITAPVTPPSSSSGLSPGAKAGIGVGVSIAGLAAVGGMVALIYLRRRRSSRNAAAAEATDKVQPSPATQGQYSELASPGTATETLASPAWEKNGSPVHGELAAHPHDIAVEMDGERSIYELMSQEHPSELEA